MKKKHWYNNGLYFGCRQCGKCCIGEEGFVWVTEEEISRLAVMCNMDRAEFERIMVREVSGKKSLVECSNGDCVLFDRAIMGCRCYQDRPVQCRTWPFWQYNIRSKVAWLETANFCPGCDNPNGKLYTEEEIDERVKDTPF